MEKHRNHFFWKIHTYRRMAKCSLNYSDKKIIVIGSLATAATTIPVLIKKAKHVIMLQRTPTFYRTSTIGTRKLQH